MDGVPAAQPSARATKAVLSSGVRADMARYDLQGLRGIGVLLVVVGHLWLWPPGAFGALDVFFVLSGYFITGILVDRHRAEGRWGLKEFYAGRARRLLPTALTVIGVTLLLTRLLFSPARARPVATEGLWAAVFGSNWYFADQGIDYFTNLGASPLLHYWSLSLEEQFYLVWPWLLALAVALGLGCRRRATRNLVVVMGVLAVASFAYSLWHSTAHPTSAYFSTFDRVWEFAVGGLLALARPVLAGMPAGVIRAVTWSAIALAAGMLAFLRYGMAFPAPWGLLPVVSCGMLIAAGVSDQARPPRLLTNLPLVYLGTISYSLYLWHLPVSFLLRSWFVDDTTTYRVVALLTAVAIGALSFHLLERPARRSPWLMTARERERIRAKPPLDWRSVQVGWAVTLAGAVGMSILAAQVTYSDQVRTSREARSIAGHTPDRGPDSRGPGRGRADGHVSATHRQSERVARALAQESFPTFSPPLRELSFDAWTDAVLEDGCTSVTLDEAPRCRFGAPDAPRTAVLVGDSFATAWAGGIRAALEPRGWSVQQFTLFGCPTWTMPSYYQQDRSAFPECAEHHGETVRLLRDLRPDLLVVASAVMPYQGYRPVFGGNSSPADFAQARLGRTLSLLTPLAGRTVVLQPPPRHAYLPDCVTRFSAPADCVTSVSDVVQETDAGEAAASEQHGAEYVETVSWFCIDGRCPAFMGTTPVAAESHLTLEFSRSLADVLREVLLPRRR